MNDVIYRKARPEDIPAMIEVFLTSLSDMNSRYQIKEALPPAPVVSARYRHVLETGNFQVAEVDGQVAVIASSVIRGRLWFLSTFWARPGMQHKGMGMPLFKKVWEEGQAAGATTFFTHASPDLTAIASYMKLGMLPGYQIMYFQGKPQKLPAVPAGYEASALEKATAIELDRRIRGTGREQDHQFWLSNSSFQGWQAASQGKTVGYYYIGNGIIGPAAWNEPSDAEAVLNLACRQAASMMPEIRLSVPGINHAGLRFCLQSGLRITSVFNFLSTAAFGLMQQYIPSGASLY